MKASLNRWIGKMPDISAVFARFPVPVGLMAVFTLIIIVIDNLGANDRLGWLLTGFVLSAYMCVNITLSRETHKTSQALPLQIGVSAVLLLLSWFAKDIRFIVPIAIGGAILLLGNMAQWKKPRDDVHVWDFTHKIWTGAVFATVGSMIYAAGVFAIMAALKSLFGLNVEWLVEDFLLPIGLGFLAPLYWLSTVPDVDEAAPELYDNPGFVSKAVAFMGTWLLAPLTLIYALILVAYGLKIIVAGLLPKGEIAGLTTPFLIIGTLTWLVLDPPFAKDKSLAKIFRKTWFILSIPAALLLAVAVGVRVAEYGVTEERLALIFCVIWALALGLWFVFGPKDKRDIRIIPGLAAGLMFIAAFALLPISLFSQTARAQSALKAAGIMTDAGVIKPLPDIKIVNEAAARKAKGALHYLERNDGWPRIAGLFEGADNIPTENGKPDRNLYKRLALNNISLHTANENIHVSYYSDKDPISVRGFDVLTGPFWVNWNNASRKDAAKTSGFTIEMKGDELVVSRSGTEQARYDIVKWAAGQDIIDQQVRVDDPVIEILSDGERKLSLVVRSLNYQIGTPETFNGEVMLLSAGY